MMENAKISVIMPVYGVEAYVGKAIESIQKQTYKNWEFFCVDDGTKDRSGEICDEAGRYGDGSREEQFPVCCNGLLY